MTNWTLICLSPCVLISIGAALFAIYASLDHVYGPQGARLIWPHELTSLGLGLLAATAASLALNAIRDEILEIPILLAMSAANLITAINTYTVRKNIQSAQSILYRSPLRKKYAVALFLLISAFGTLSLALIPLYPTSTAIYKLFVMLLVILIWILGVNTYLRAKNLLILKETGLVVGGSVYPWDKIRLYYLAPPRRYAPLILRLKGWFPLTNTAIVPLTLDEVDEVTVLLGQRLPALRYGERTGSSRDEAPYSLKPGYEEKKA